MSKSASNISILFITFIKVFRKIPPFPRELESYFMIDDELSNYDTAWVLMRFFRDLKKVYELTPAEKQVIVRTYWQMHGMDKYIFLRAFTSPRYKSELIREILKRS